VFQQQAWLVVSNVVAQERAAGGAFLGAQQCLAMDSRILPSRQCGLSIRSDYCCFVRVVQTARRVRDYIRRKGYSIRAEKSYVRWMRRFVPLCSVSRQAVLTGASPRLFQAQHVLHVEQAVRLALQEAAGAQGAEGVGHAAGGFVGDFDALAGTGEQHGVIADDVAAANCGETDLRCRAFAGVAVAAIHGAVGEVATERGGDDFAHAQGGAGRGVDLVPVVGFDDFDIVPGVENPRGDVEQLEHRIDADGHVGREDDGNVARGLGDDILFRRREAGGADHHGDAPLAAGGEVTQRALRAGEVDQAICCTIRRSERGVDVRGNGDAAGRAECFAGILAERRASVVFEGASERGVRVAKHGFDQRAAHATGAAGDGVTDGVHGFLLGLDALSAAGDFSWAASCGFTWTFSCALSVGLASGWPRSMTLLVDSAA